MLDKQGILTTETTVLQGPMMLLTTGATVLEWLGDFFSLYNGKPNEALDAFRYRRFCEKVSCQRQTVHGQPQDLSCASRLVPE